ncbi:hypothetical protein J3Q64DRAFT_1721996 [Phycomyces blakesleeanus]|uniref:Uncharacterized protein n=1 Tax=Phycomyces blakesleeanus TaxID=4837 RepID=A0ABR3BBH5_PHYBL
MYTYLSACLPACLPTYSCIYIQYIKYSIIVMSRLPPEAGKISKSSTIQIIYFYLIIHTQYILYV